MVSVSSWSDIFKNSFPYTIFSFYERGAGPYITTKTYSLSLRSIDSHSYLSVRKNLDRMEGVVRCWFEIPLRIGSEGRKQSNRRSKYESSHSKNIFTKIIIYLTDKLSSSKFCFP